MTHFGFVAASYGLSAIGMLGLAAWILLDQRARRREMAELESKGIKRRSDQGSS